MKILYHNTLPKSPLPEAEAVYKEIDSLHAHFGGEIINVYPQYIKRVAAPKQLYGLHRRGVLKQLDQQVDAHHIMFPFFYDFPYTKVLSKPIIYTCTTSKDVRYSISEGLRRYSIITESDSQYRRYSQSPFNKVDKILPGIEIDTREVSSAPDDNKFRLLMASAPHSPGQFKSKKIYLLLDYVKRHSDIELTLLWRGVHSQKIKRLISSSKLNDRVTLVDEYVDVKPYYDRCNATVLLCDEDGVVKNYPHSLIESVLYGRPVITSSKIEMSDLITKSNLGLVLNNHNVDELHKAVSQIRANYGNFKHSISQFDRSVFNVDTYLSKVSRVYQLVKR